MAADLSFTKISIRNFLTVGNVEEEILLDTNLLTLVLGQNLDSGGENSRNGVGKSTILSAIFFAIYGTSVGTIKKDNLVNNINNKHMEVMIEFTKHGKKYKIMRGRKPAYLKFFIDDGLVKSPDEDEAQGESKYTQQEIEKLIGMSAELFKQIVFITTDTQQIIAMRPAEQRILIEELLGITLISTRAEKLKELMKNTKEQIKEEEMRIKTQKENNDRILKMITDVESKYDKFETTKATKIAELQSVVDTLQKINIEEELSFHDTVAQISLLKSELSTYIKEKNYLDKHQDTTSNKLQSLLHDLEHAKNKTCPTCKQDIEVSNEQEIVDTILQLNSEYESNDKKVIELTAKITEIEEFLKSIPQIETVYQTKEEALHHKHTISYIAESLDNELKTVNPYTEQIEQLKTTGLVEVSAIELEQMKLLFQHQEFLYKLLTNKDSFIRKKIIDANIAHINYKVNAYLDKLALPHEVSFNNDLTIGISLLGRDFDFPQLSKGERNRVLLATSWAFRDVWEDHNQTVNLMFVDEMLDNGLDNSGAERALDIMKTIVRDKKKTCYLISHKEELIGRVSNVLMVKKESGFTSFETR